MASVVLLDLMGGVALLLWGLHMVLTGVLRAFGPHLRRFLGKAFGNRFSAFGAGLGLTAGLAALVWLLARASGVPMDFPLFVDVPVAVSLLTIAILSGALSLRILKKSQPADLLR